MDTWLEQNAVNLIGHALTVIGIIAAAAMVVWQLGRQHKSSLLLQRDNAREELKLRLHELLVQKVRKLERANSRASMYAFSIPFNVKNFQDQLEHGSQPYPIKERASVFAKLHGDASSALVELIQEFEAWSIAFPGIEVFKGALNAANHDVREAHSSLFTTLLRVLPIDRPEGAPPNLPSPLVPNPISSDELAHLCTLVELYKAAMDDIVSYVHDLTIESQNNLLSRLFERRVSPRKPIDPKHKVISTDPEKMVQLLHYFENETAWGKARLAAEADARANIGAP